MKNKNSSIRARIKSAPFGMQVILLMTAMITALTAIVLSISYHANKQILISDEVASSRKILVLEMNSLNDYLSGLGDFSLQPCYDSRFIKDLYAKDPLPDEELEYIKNKMSEYYYTRSDITSYCIYFLNQDLRVGRMLREQTFKVTSNLPTSSDMVAFEKCCGTEKGIAIIPSDNKGLLFTFYRIIRPLERNSTLALVRTDVDHRDIRKVLSSRLHPDEYRVLLTDDGQLLYSELPDSCNASFAKQYFDLRKYADSNETFPEISLDGVSYLVGIHADSKYGMQLASLIPLSKIHIPLNHLLLQTIFWGFLLWFIAIGSTYILTLFVTKPFQLFIKEIDSVGNGGLNTDISVEGCREINQLRDSFQDMGLRIQTLMRQNYIARMDEQNARLSSEGSLVNPMLIYHALREMSEDSNLFKEEDAQDFSANLAALVRYSVKGGNFVTVREEIRHAQFLSKIYMYRLKTKFPFVIESDPSIDQLLIPRLTIMKMMDYVIPEEYTYEDEIPEILINAGRTESRLIINIKNTSRLLTPEEQAQLKKQLSDCEVPGNTPANVLCSLYERLWILCEKDVNVHISNDESSHTVITIDLPVTP